MAATKKKSAPAKKAAVKAPAKKAAPAKAAKAPKAKAVVAADLDRKGLAAKARQLKLELLAIRFNLQSPSLKEYRNKKKELASVLASLR